jgi:membrane protease YdiL (CAAX protease family)
MFPRAPENRMLSLRVFVLAMALYIGLALLVVFVLFPAGILNAFATPTHGLVTATLVANLLFLALNVGVVLCLLGGLRSGDIGLRISDLPTAFVLTIGTWLAVNVIEAAWQLIVDGHLRWNENWHERGITAFLGWLVAQIFGNALYEEIFFRGILLRQIYWRLEATRCPKLQRLAIAIAVSQTLFAVIHLPILLSGGMSVAAAFAKMPAIFISGSALAILYAQSDNLMLCVGIHALANTPTLLVADYFDLPNNLLFVTVSCLVITALSRKRTMREKRLAC